MSAVTVEDAKSWRMRESMHGHGKGFFFYRHTCVEQPRLSRHDRYERGSRSVVSTWMVDGNDCQDFAAAINSLNVPPTVTADEVSALASMPLGYSDQRKGVGYEMLFALRTKGLLDFEERLCRPSHLGRAAIAGELSVENTERRQGQ